MPEKQTSSPVTPFKFRLRLALYWGVLGHLTLWLVFVFGSMISSRQDNIQDFFEPNQIVIFLLCALTGFLVLPRYITNKRRAKWRAFYGGMFSFFVAIFCANFIYFQVTFSSLEIPSTQTHATNLLSISGSFLVALMVSPLGGLFGWLAQVAFKKTLERSQKSKAPPSGTTQAVNSERTSPRVTGNLVSSGLSLEKNESPENNRREPTLLLHVILGLSWGLTVYALYHGTAQLLDSYKIPWLILKLIVDEKIFAAVIFGTGGFVFLPRHLNPTVYTPSNAFTRGTILSGLISIAIPLFGMIFLALLSLNVGIFTHFITIFSVLKITSPISIFLPVLALTCGLSSYVTYRLLYFSSLKAWFWKEADIFPPPETTNQETGNASDNPE